MKFWIFLVLLYTYHAFKCKDGSNNDAVLNDDYCDCLDGSDEPTTPACSPMGFFNCQNKGHLPILIPSSRLQDGICDSECCDGSDEPGLNCPNTCATIGKEYQTLIKSKHDLISKGLEIKSKYLKSVQSKRMQRETSIKMLELELKELENKLSMVSSSVNGHSESLSNEFKNIKQSIESLYHQYNNNSNVKTLMAYTRRFEKSFTLAMRDGMMDKDGFGPCENPDTSIYMCVLSGLDDIKSFLWFPRNSKEYLQKDTHHVLIQDLKNMIDTCSSTNECFSLIQNLQSFRNRILFIISSDTFSESYPTSLQNMLVNIWNWKGYSKLYNHFMNVHNSLNDLELVWKEQERKSSEKLREILKLHQIDFGIDKSMEYLYLNCYSMDQGEYTYELCLMGQAFQRKSKDSSSKIVLGNFLKWNSPKELLYNQGETCWNGPQRSVVVDLICAIENKLISVSEPSKCEYKFEFKTPIGCYDVDLPTLLS